MHHGSTTRTFAAAAKALSSSCGACTPLPGVAGGSLSVYALFLFIIAAETANYAKINEIEESAGANYGKHADRQA